MAISWAKWFLVLELLFPAGDWRGFHHMGKVAAHPFYVSVTDISQNAKDNLLEVSCKFFTDDFETTLRSAFSNKLDLSSAAGHAEADKCISAYVPAHLKLSINGIARQLEYVGSEKESEGTWTYFQVSHVTSVKQVDLVNTLLYESFPGQISIIHISANGSHKSTKLNNPESTVSFSF
jgi:hypothetical protein